jgi:hypothetical protein
MSEEERFVSLRMWLRELLPGSGVMVAPGMAVSEVELELDW